MRVTLELIDPELDLEQLDTATAALRRELLDLDVEAVERPPGGPAPAGARGSALEVATLLVTLANSEALAGVTALLRSWLGGRGTRSVRLRLGDDEIEIDGATPGQQDQLVQAFLERHGAVD
jgi:hypothetical protein